MNLVQLFYRSVTNQPQKECIRYKRNGQYQSYTYQEVWEMVTRFADGLQACGIGKGDKVGILSQNCPEWPISDLAALSIEAVVVPVYPTLPANQVQYILQHSKAKCVIAQDETQLQKLYASWPEPLEFVILIQASGNTIQDPRVRMFSDILKLGTEQQQAIPERNLDAIPDDQLATIVYTSGTSGTPKGVMLSHRNIVSNVFAATRYVPVSNTDIALSYLPLSHIFERTVGQYAAFAFGATIAYAESIETILNNLQEVRPTILVTVPRLLEKVYTRIQSRIENLPGFLRWLCQKGQSSQSSKNLTYRLVDLLIYQKVRTGLGGRMRYMVSGGAGLAANIAEFFTKAGIPVYEGYGMTESAPVVCVNPYGNAKPGTVGIPIPGVEVKLAEDGELLVKGPNVMMGYYNAPEETKNTISEDGWLHTGDIAAIENGYVKIVDRKKNLLVLATGKNVAPWPIENAISLSPYISETILIGDRRQYVTCLVFPDFESLRPIAEKLQLGNDQREWVSHPKIQHLICKEIVTRTAPFAKFEQPKRAIIMPNALTLEAGELTPTLKIRNQIILKKYAELIEDMYNGKNYVPLESDLPDSTESIAIESNPPIHQSMNKGSSLLGLAVAGFLVGIAMRLLL